MEPEEKTFEEQIDQIIQTESAELSSEQPVAVVSVLDVEPVAKTVEQVSVLAQLVTELKSSVDRLVERMEGVEKNAASVKSELEGTQRAVIKFADHVASKLRVQVQEEAVELASKSVLERSAARLDAERPSTAPRTSLYFPNNAPGG